MNETKYNEDFFSEKKGYRWTALKLIIDIAHGKFKAGERLPSWIELCEIYKTPNFTMRKVIDYLKSEDIVIGEAGSGIYISDNVDFTVDLMKRQMLEHLKESVESCYNLNILQSEVIIAVNDVYTERDDIINDNQSKEKL